MDTTSAQASPPTPAGPAPQGPAGSPPAPLVVFATIGLAANAPVFDPRRPPSRGPAWHQPA